MISFIVWELCTCAPEGDRASDAFRSSSFVSGGVSVVSGVHAVEALGSVRVEEAAPFAAWAELDRCEVVGDRQEEVRSGRGPGSTTHQVVVAVDRSAPHVQPLILINGALNAWASSILRFAFFALVVY